MSFLEEYCKQIENQGRLIFYDIGDGETSNLFESPISPSSDLFFCHVSGIGLYIIFLV